MKVYKYVLEQKFPSKDKQLIWYESDEYDTEKEALGRLDDLKRAKRSGFRIVEKQIQLKIIKEI